MGMSEVRRGSARGFTLIELMIVIVIVAVLLGIALPAYQKQILRGHRAAAKAEIMEIANRQVQYLLANRTYTADPNDFAYTLPDDVAARYDFTVTVSASSAPYFLISAAPKGSQLKDGSEALTLDSQGEKLPEDKWAR